MRIIAADDEALALQSLEKAIRAAKPEEEVVSFQEPEDVLEYAKEHPIDVAVSGVPSCRSMHGISSPRRC